MKLGEQLYYQQKDVWVPIIITHRNCPDGSASAVIAKEMEPNTLWYPASHHKINDQVIKTINNLKPGGTLYIVDICCDEKTLTRILPTIKEKNAFVGIYDHHETTSWLEDFKTSKNFPSGFPTEKLEIIFDHQRCGSKIFYDRHLKDFPKLEKFDDFITVNNDRDLWLLKDPRSNDLARFHDILQDEGYVERFYNNPKVEFDEKETYLLQYTTMYENQKHERLLKNIKIKKDEENYKYGLIYGEADSSNLLNKAIERFDLEYAILINLNTKKGSIRGRGNKNCTTYAEKFGGGGHRCASGFQIEFNEPQF